MAGNSEMTVIGRDTKIKGEMTFDSGARILGTFEGKISSAGEVQVGEGANCLAAIDAQRVVVDGQIQGDITAGEVLTLNADARVQGDIVANKLIVIEGATFEGNCRVGPSVASGATTTRSVGSGLQTGSSGSTGSGSATFGSMSKPATANKPLTESKPVTETTPIVETRVGSTGAVEAA